MKNQMQNHRFVYVLRSNDQRAIKRFAESGQQTFLTGIDKLGLLPDLLSERKYNALRWLLNHAEDDVSDGLLVFAIRLNKLEAIPFLAQSGLDVSRGLKYARDLGNWNMVASLEENAVLYKLHQKARSLPKEDHSLSL